MNETLLLQLMNNLIFQNGNRLISGTVLNQVLDQMIQYAQVNELDAPFTPNNTSIVAGDSIFEALEKCQGQINGFGGAVVIERGAVIWVDSVYGNDFTGVREDFTKPFQTIDAAIAASALGDTIILGKGTYVATVNLFVNALNYVIEKGTVLMVSALNSASTAGVSHSIRGAGTLLMNQNIEGVGTFNGVIEIDVDRIEIAPGVFFNMSTTPIIGVPVVGELVVRANYVSFNEMVVQQAGASSIRFKAGELTNAGLFPALQVFFFGGASFTAGKRRHYIDIDNAFVGTNAYGLVMVQAGDVKEEIYMNVNGRMFGVGGSLPAVVVGSVTCASYVRCHGRMELTNCAYVTNDDGTLKFHGTGLIQHVDGLSRPVVSVCNGGKFLIETDIIGDTNNDIVQQNNPIWGGQSVGAVELELRGQIRNLSVGASAHGILVETNTGRLRIDKVRIQLAGATNSIRTTTGPTNVRVYSGFANLNVSSGGGGLNDLVNVIAGTALIVDTDVIVTDLTS